MKKIIVWTAGAAALIAVLALVLKVVFEDPHVAHGRVLYTKYCAGCHGPKGVGDGFNAENLDPYPRDLSDSLEPYMAEGTNEEIFSAIATGVAGSAPAMEGLAKHVHDHGDDEGEEGGMHEMSEEDTGDGHDESEHAHSEGMDHDEPMKHDEPMMHDEPMKHESAMTGDEVDIGIDLDAEDEDAIGSPLMPYWGFTFSDEQIWELVAFVRTLHSNDAPPVEFDESIDTHRRRPSVDQHVEFPSLDSTRGQKLAVIGKRLFNERYACNACHSIQDEGGKIGPALDRAGVRLNAKWIYRWIQDPQSIRRDATMPAFGLPDIQAKALTLYLMTLRAPAE